MATNSVTVNKRLSYNMTGNVSNSKSGWDEASGGYASTWDAMALKFTPSAFSGDGYSISSINVSFNYRKSGSGTYYFYLLTSDPTSSSLNDIKSSYSHFATESWSGKSSWQTKNLTLSYTTKLNANTSYYLLMRGSDSISEISGMSISLTYSYWTNGTKPSGLSMSQTAGSNTVYFTGNRGQAGTNNSIVSGTLKYKIGDGSWTDINLGTTSGGDYSKSITMTSANDDKVVSAYVVYDFTHGDNKYNYSSSEPKTKTCYYYSAGGTPTCNIAQTAGSNTVTFSGTRGTNGNRNEKTASTLYYKYGSGSWQTVSLGVGTTYSTSITMTSGNNNKVITAYVLTAYPYGNKQCSEKTLTGKYYSDVDPPTFSFTDNGDNSFSITATAGASGSNNTSKGLVSGSCKWGYTTSSRDTEFTNGARITLDTSGTGATRTVYAEAKTDATYINDIKGTGHADIKQYLSPTAPGKPSLDSSSYKNNRLTVKKNWKYTWTASSKQGQNGVTGYRIKIEKKPKNGTSFSAITGLTCTNNVISKGTGTNTEVYSTNTTCNISFDPGPNGLGFVAGDQIKVTVWGYSVDGTTSKTKKHSSAVISDATTVQNAGVMQIKVNNTWKEGVVWIKVNNTWKEASAIFAKVDSSWKEST